MSQHTLSNVPNAIERTVDEFGYLGGFGENTGYFDGAIAEIIVYDRAVDLGVTPVGERFISTTNTTEKRSS